MSASLRHHMAVSARMLAGVTHADNREAGFRGPRAHDWEYIIFLRAKPLPDGMEWVRKRLRQENDGQ
jgi:hypothetical protein